MAHRKACREHGVIPIFGVETYFRPNRLVREKEWRYRRWHLILLAKNLTGWHNIVKLTSAAYGDGFYQSPCVDGELLRKYREGVICTTACVSGPLSHLIQNGTDKQVATWTTEFLDIFGDDLYFSIMPHEFALQREINVAVAQIAAKVGRPVVHEKDSHYPEAGWEETQKIAILTGINKTFAEFDQEAQKRVDAGEDPYELWHPNLNISTEDEDRALYAQHHPDLPQSVIDEAMDSTEEILAKVEPFSIDRTIKMPRVFLKEHDSAKAQVLRWAREGLKEMGRDGDPVYEQRIEYEASVIDQVGAWEYFWVVADVVRWCRSGEPLPATEDDPNPPRKKPIRLNSGRGSAAASLICRTTKITMINPITHKFKFERFMNPERRSMPDVDLDVASSRRGEVKEYMARRHGRGSIADIVAYQHFQPRAALKAVAKAMYGFDSEAYKRVAALTHENTGVIDPVNDVDLGLIREREPALDEWAKSFPDAWEHAVRLENHGDPSVLRMSKHAAGVALLPGDVSDVMPTVRADEEEKTPRTAWAETTKVSVTEEIGVVKIDFLGLSGMDRQQMILDLVQEHTGEVIDIDGLPFLDDPYDVEDEVMEVFRQGLTLGVNQFSGDGITSFVRDAAPENIVDLAAINALYRPGPLGSGGHNRFVKRRRGIDVPDYPPVLQEVLGDTALTISFQEQVMELFERLADYTPGEADNVRKIIAKYYRDKSGLAQEKLAELEAVFVPRAAEKIGQGLAESLWQEILPYSGYSFNRAHAGSYVVQAEQDAWLKKHYPIFAYPTYLTLDEDKTLQYLREARHPMFGLSVLPPDVNISGDGFTPDLEANAIRFGLRGIKGIGEAVAQQIVADRPFASLEDFEERESRKYSKVNKRAREILLQVGALDSLGARSDWDAKTRASFEAQLLGVALDPAGILGEDSDVVRSSIHSEAEVAAMVEGQEVIVAGKVVEMNRTRVKKQGRMHGRAMATGIKVALDLEQYVCVCFPDQWDRFEEQLGGEEMVIIRGKLDPRGTVIINDVMLLEDFIREQKYEEVAA